MLFPVKHFILPDFVVLIILKPFRKMFSGSATVIEVTQYLYTTFTREMVPNK